MIILKRNYFCRCHTLNIIFMHSILENRIESNEFYNLFNIYISFKIIKKKFKSFAIKFIL